VTALLPYGLNLKNLRHELLLVGSKAFAKIFSTKFFLLTNGLCFSLAFVEEMRPLTDQETKTLFTKLASYIGRNISALIDRPSDSHVFRLHKDRVYYVSTQLANLATSLTRTSLLSLGTCLGKFSKTGKFRLHVTALDYLAQHAIYKVWVKPNGEMPFLYGNHVLKAHVGRITQDTPEHQGVVVYSMSDVPLVNFSRRGLGLIRSRGLVSPHGRQRIRES